MTITPIRKDVAADNTMDPLRQKLAAVIAEAVPGPPMARCNVVPIATVPPPAEPDASILRRVATGARRSGVRNGAARPSSRRAQR